jgi:hypothetical protein
MLTPQQKIHGAILIMEERPVPNREDGSGAQKKHAATNQN